MRKRVTVLAIAVLALLVVAGCGGSSNKSSSGSSSAATTTTAGAKKGGNLIVMSASDVDSLDPGYWYYQYDYMALMEPTQRSLYGWEADKTQPTPTWRQARHRFPTAARH